jgi:hypothetical protein
MLLVKSLTLSWSLLHFFVIQVLIHKKEELKPNVFYHIRSATLVPHDFNILFKYIVKYFNFCYPSGRSF